MNSSKCEVSLTDCFHCGGAVTSPEYVPMFSAVHGIYDVPICLVCFSSRQDASEGARQQNPKHSLKGGRCAPQTNLDDTLNVDTCGRGCDQLAYQHGANYVLQETNQTQEPKRITPTCCTHERRFDTSHGSDNQSPCSEGLGPF